MFPVEDNLHAQVLHDLKQLLSIVNHQVCGVRQEHYLKASILGKNNC